MKKILVFSGTKDGRMLIEQLIKRKFEVEASVASELGAEFLKQYECVTIHIGKLDSNKICQLISRIQPFVVIDASHPYAIEVSINTMRACEILKKTYIRFERSDSILSERVIRVADYDEAVTKLNEIKGNILITTGTNKLAKFKEVSDWENRVIVRTLYGEEAQKRCFDLGFGKENIICCNGPFSKEQNLEHIKKFSIKVMVSKESGQTGGIDEKEKAALESHIPFIVIERPSIEYRNKFENIDKLIDYVEELK